MAEEKKGARKYDQVALNTIWSEHIKKERSLQKLNEEFRLNPHQLAANIITDKPNIDPKVYGLHVDADPETVAELDNILKETKKAPTEKYDAPLTTSQEIGWHSVPLMPGRKRFGTKQCEITAYADAYSSAMGKNPFARKDPIVSNP